jgi:hypothetical protein
MRNGSPTVIYFCLDGEMIASAAGDNIVMTILKNRSKNVANFLRFCKGIK